MDYWIQGPQSTEEETETHRNHLATRPVIFPFTFTPVYLQSLLLSAGRKGPQSQSYSLLSRRGIYINNFIFKIRVTTL